MKQVLIQILLLHLAIGFVSVVVTQQQQQQQQLQPDYRRYLRTRRPSLVGERHVEEVLEVFRTEAQPPPYRLNHTDVNHFLALERLHELQRRRTTTTTARTITAGTTTTTTTTATPDASTYRAPTYENRNPEYRYLYRWPLITATEIGATNITIKEADA
ncbi:hypothetical protein AND_005746 [Anopheles darlingi]|uniref:Secreted protein n=1 Tax=Anopheles darlingi TaxID=43151 RepID=W5JGW1_ANODA|nr:hypothetical protein AND_005746 [Anopheles darlingi]